MRTAFAATALMLVLGACNTHEPPQASREKDSANQPPGQRTGAYGATATGDYGRPGVGGDDLPAGPGRTPSSNVEPPPPSGAAIGGKACQRLASCFHQLTSTVCTEDDRVCHGAFSTASVPTDEPTCRNVLARMPVQARPYLERRKSSTLPPDCKAD